MKREDILKFANYTCERCKKKFPPEALEIHHPHNSKEPIQVLCRKCHKEITKRRSETIMINGEEVPRSAVNISRLIIKEIKEKPYLKYSYFTRKYGISEKHYWQIRHRAKKKGLL